MIPKAITGLKSRSKSAIFFITNPNIILIKYEMMIAPGTRLKDCKQKIYFKMETLNFPLFLHTIRNL